MTGVGVGGLSVKSHSQSDCLSRPGFTCPDTSSIRPGVGCPVPPSLSACPCPRLHSVWSPYVQTIYLLSLGSILVNFIMNLPALEEGQVNHTRRMNRERRDIFGGQFHQGKNFIPVMKRVQWSLQVSGGVAVLESPTFLPSLSV